MTSEHRIRTQGVSIVDRLCLVFLILSGMAAVTYQVVWVRLLGLSMGSTSASVGTVLAAFFLGMSLGSFLAGRVLARFGAVLGLYAAIELLIGGTALLLLPVLVNLDQVMAAMGTLGEQLPVKFSVAMLLLAVPSTCIGATFPVMAAFMVRRGGPVGASLGVLYSVNTMGAVLGAALSGFLFIPALGLDGAVFLGVAANLGVAVTAWALVRRESTENAALAPETHSPDARKGAAAGSAAAPLAILALTGFTSIASEVGYTKYLSIFMGTTIYGFASILAVFLIGIALGSWWIRRRIDGIARPEAWVMTILLLLAATMAAARSALGVLPEYSGHGILLRLLLVLAILLPPTFLLGALFPLNLHMVCSRAGTVRQKAGMAYAVNTLGSIGGSLAAGFVLIPWLGTDLLLVLMAVLTGTGALLFVRGLPGRQAVLAGGGLLAVLAGCLLLPRLDYADMLRAGGGSLAVKGEIVDLVEGKSAVVSMSSLGNGWMVVHNNGLPQAALRKEDPRVGTHFGVFLGAVAYALHPDPKSAFIVGFGGGAVAHGLAASELERVRVVELEPAVIDVVERLHGGRMDIRDDPRISVEVNDARNTLLLSPERYDLIVSQPSHPWVAGASAVFTEEFFELAASRLRPGGLFSQWISLTHLDERAFHAIVQAYFRVFPYGLVFASASRGQGAIYMVGGLDPLEIDFDRVDARLSAPQVVEGPIGRYLHDADDVFGYYLFTRQEALALTGNARPNTDLNVLSEVSQPYWTETETDDALFDGIAGQVTFAGVPGVFGEGGPRVIWAAGDALLRQGRYRLAQSAMRQLRPAHPDLADALYCQGMLGEYRYPAAFAHCLREGAWPDRFRVSMIQALIDLQRYDDAARWAGAIADPVFRGRVRARLLAETGAWEALSARTARSAEERAWQLLAVGRADPGAAAAELADILSREPSAVGIPHLKFLVAYQSRTGAALPVDVRAVLNSRSRWLENQLAGYVQVARKEGDERRVAFLTGLRQRMLYLSE